MNSANDDAERVSDVAAVTALFGRLKEAWAAGDAEAYADCFSPDADYVTFLGSNTKGRRNIVDTHEALWTRFQKNTRLHQVVDSMRFVAEDVVIVVARGAILKSKQRSPKRGDWKIQTLVAVRRESGWIFEAFQNTKHRWLFERIGARKDPRLAPNPRT